MTLYLLKKNYRIEQHFSDIFQPIIMSVFTWSLFGTSSALLFIQMGIVKSIGFLPYQNDK